MLYTECPQLNDVHSNPERGFREGGALPRGRWQMVLRPTDPPSASVLLLKNGTCD